MFLLFSFLSECCLAKRITYLVFSKQKINFYLEISYIKNNKLISTESVMSMVISFLLTPPEGFRNYQIKKHKKWFL